MGTGLSAWTTSQASPVLIVCLVEGEVVLERDKPRPFSQAGLRLLELLIFLLHPPKC